MEAIAIQPVLSVEGSRKQELPAHRFVNATVDAAAAKVSGLTGTEISPPLHRLLQVPRAFSQA